jgi:hypothetical protein
MTTFDTETDQYLERVGMVDADSDWDDVLRRALRGDRVTRRVRVGVGVGVTVTAAAVALALVAPLPSDSLLDKAQAAVLAPVQAADGTIEHVLIEYRPESGDPFIEYETWIAADGAWCRRTVEGIPGQRVADTRLTQCGSPDGTREVHLPASDEILRTRPGDTAGSDITAPRSGESDKPKPIYKKGKDGKAYLVSPSGKPAPVQPEESVELPAVDTRRTPGWLTEDVIGQFRREAVHEAGTTTLDGREYAKLVTDDGLNAVLVDPDTGEAVAWIPSPKAFGTPTTVVQTRDTLPDDAPSRRNLSLTELYPDAVVRDVSASELAAAISSQYPRG